MWRAIGGFMMVVSHVIFLVNLWAMRPYQSKNKLAAYPSLSEGEVT